MQVLFRGLHTPYTDNNPQNRHERKETWSEDNPDELADDLIEILQSALESFQELQAQLKK